MSEADELKRQITHGNVRLDKASEVIHVAIGNLEDALADLIPASQGNDFITGEVTRLQIIKLELETKAREVFQSAFNLAKYRDNNL